MNKPRRTLLTLSLVPVLLAAAAGAAVTPTENPFLWVLPTTPPSFLFGTVHLPDDRVLALPDVVTAAFDASDVVYTEIPMDINTQLDIVEAFMLDGDETLADLIPKELYDRADALFESKGFSIALFQKFKVYAIAVQLPLLDYIAEMATKEPLDMMLYTRAAEEGKETGGLETPEEQVAVFESFSLDEQIELLRNTLDYVEKAEKAERSAAERLIEAYVKGDGEALWGVANEYLDPNDPVDRKFMHIAVTERNRRMADRIVARLREEPGKMHFFAVGAMHFHRDDGILALMRAAGYKPRRLHANDAKELERILGAAAVDQ